MLDTKVYSVLMNKGGVGKTTLITNLAATLSRQGKKVLLVDTDGQANCCFAFGQPMYNTTIFDVIVNNVPIQDVIRTIEPGLDFLPSDEQMSLLESEVYSNKDVYKYPYFLIKPHLSKLLGKYDYILIDTPPAWGLIAANVLIASDQILVPFEPDGYTVQGLKKVVDTVEKYKSINEGLNIAGLIGMKVNIRTTLHSEMLKKARDFCRIKNIRLFKTVIPSSIKYSHSTVFFSKPAVWVNAEDKLVKPYINLTKEVFLNG